MTTWACLSIQLSAKQLLILLHNVEWVRSSETAMLQQLVMMKLMHAKLISDSTVRVNGLSGSKTGFATEIENTAPCFAQT